MLAAAIQYLEQKIITEMIFHILCNIIFGLREIHKTSFYNLITLNSLHYDFKQL